jgi:hypothetical protein
LVVVELVAALLELLELTEGIQFSAVLPQLAAVVAEHGKPPGAR